MGRHHHVSCLLTESASRTRVRGKNVLTHRIDTIVELAIDIEGGGSGTAFLNVEECDEVS